MQAAIALAHFFAGRYAEASFWADTAAREQPNFSSQPVRRQRRGARRHSAEAERAMARVRQLDPTLRAPTLANVPVPPSGGFRPVGRGIARGRTARMNGVPKLTLFDDVAGGVIRVPKMGPGAVSMMGLFAIAGAPRGCPHPRWSQPLGECSAEWCRHHAPDAARLAPANCALKALTRCVVPLPTPVAAARARNQIASRAAYPHAPCWHPPPALPPEFQGS